LTPKASQAVRSWSGGVPGRRRGTSRRAPLAALPTPRGVADREAVASPPVRPSQPLPRTPWRPTANSVPGGKEAIRSAPVEVDRAGPAHRAARGADEGRAVASREFGATCHAVPPIRTRGSRVNRSRTVHDARAYTSEEAAVSGDTSGPTAAPESKPTPRRGSAGGRSGRHHRLAGWRNASDRRVAGSFRHDPSRQSGQRSHSTVTGIARFLG
jgi:hypothetical protein